MAFFDVSLLTGFVVLLLMGISLARTRDTLAPAIVFGAMLLFQYVFYPIRFELTVPVALRGMLDERQLVFAQSLFLGGTTCLMLGLVIGSGVRRRGAPLFAAPALTPGQRHAARKAGRVLTVLSLGSVVYATVSAGRLVGEVGSQFGYLNEAYHFCVPATALYLLSISHRRLTSQDLLICIFLMSPLLIRGLLVAKRGPTLIFVIGLTVMWFFAARRRPSIGTLALGGAATVFLIAILFFNRDAIWSGRTIDTAVDPLAFASINPGNDYIYGAAMANVALEQNVHDYGARYLITFFVRPIPSQIWPTKYADASATLDVGWYKSVGVSLAEGYLYLVSYPILGWAIAAGAAWGLVTDVFWEFRYFAFPVLFALGFGVGRAWRRASRSTTMFLAVVITISVAPYIVAQDLMDAGFRILFMTVPGILLFRFFERLRPGRARSGAFPPSPEQTGPSPVRRT